MPNKDLDFHFRKLDAEGRFKEYRSRYRAELLATATTILAVQVSHGISTDEYARGVRIDAAIGLSAELIESVDAIVDQVFGPEDRSAKTTPAAPTEGTK